MAPDFSWTEKKGGNRGHRNGKDVKPQPRPRQDVASPHGDGKPNHNRGPKR